MRHVSQEISAVVGEGGQLLEIFIVESPIAKRI